MILDWTAAFILFNAYSSFSQAMNVFAQFVNPSKTNNVLILIPIN